MASTTKKPRKRAMAVDGVAEGHDAAEKQAIRKALDDIWHSADLHLPQHTADFVDAILEKRIKLNGKNLEEARHVVAQYGQTAKTAEAPQPCTDLVEVKERLQDLYHKPGKLNGPEWPDDVCEFVESVLKGKTRLIGKALEKALSLIDDERTAAASVVVGAQYTDTKSGHVLFVSDGISGGKLWATYFCKLNGSLARVKSSHLKLQKTREQAQEDLDTYARRNHLEPVEPEPAANEPDEQAAAVDAELVPADAAAEKELRTLTPAEAKRRERLERKVDVNLAAYFEVGQALFEIQDAELYLSTHETFKAYVKDRWGFTRQHADRLIKGSEIRKQLEASVSPIGDSQEPILPATESVARPLSKVDEDQRAEVWGQVVADAPKDNEGRPHITAELVEDKVRKWTTPGDEQERKVQDQADAQQDRYRSVNEFDGQMNWLRKKVLKTAELWSESKPEIVATLRDLATQIEAGS
jgi:hypothetical protein